MLPASASPSFQPSQLAHEFIEFDAALPSKPEASGCHVAIQLLLGGCELKGY